MLRSLADADADEDEKGTADYDTRALATQAALGSHIDRMLRLRARKSTQTTISETVTRTAWWIRGS